MSKIWKIVLTLSIALNVLGLVAIGWYTAHVGPRTVAEQAGIVEPRRTAFQFFADERFDDLPGADTLVIGDSLVEQGRWSELLERPVANRGIYGAKTSEITGWASKIHPETQTVIVWAGTNDALDSVDFAQDYEQLLSTIESATDARIITLTAPPARGFDTSAVNLTISEVSAQHNAVVVDVTDALSQDRMLANDGLHLSGAGYVQVAKLLASKL
ncbi:SGNH/GDSL hydrolase family protein [Neomicrococcus aestuarii]|uniref:SGNH hydrolase-type esterase domain-containing protein n=1 Tax=Neomicrococcus aestuarii TaxID=556325 RepID=A0A1L2ZMM1_9MICC|nr:SGNH/GDSL hydrolase family protein [Neomicrococcus aestuarii]APF40634.1 hypothetical protein BHE16_05935 [Neomicrococcus aestuarii]